MKKNKLLLLSMATLALGALSSSLLSHASRMVSAGSLPSSEYEAWKFIDSPWSNLGGGFTAEGVKVTVAGFDTAGNDCWSRYAKIPGTNNKADAYTEAFTIDGDNAISIDFSIDWNGGANHSRNGGALDIVLFNAPDDSELARLRIWMNSAGYSNGTHSCEGYVGGDWNSKVTFDDKWIVGDASADSNIHVRFSRANMFESYIGGSDGLVRLDNANNAYLAKKTNAIIAAKKVYFRIQGDNGFLSSADVVLKKINDQPMGLVNGNFVDDLAPHFVEGAAVSSTLGVGETYEIPTYAVDELGAVTYSVTYNNETIEGKSFTAVAGQTTAVLHATDRAGNVADKEYTFEISSNIALPTITALPEINDEIIPYFTLKQFGLPTYEDETGSATVALSMKYLGEEGAEAIDLPLNNETFSHFFGADALSGQYEFVYTVTNSAGAVQSDPIVATFTFPNDELASEIPTTNKVRATYVPQGIQVDTCVPWNRTYIGEYDCDQGFDIKFIVPDDGVNAAVNNAGIDLIFETLDGQKSIWYRVWSQVGGADAPCNIYLKQEGSSPDDLEDCGWIDINVDGVAHQSEMGFDKDDFLIGRRTGGVQKADPDDPNDKAAYANFMAQIPDHHFKVYLSAGFPEAHEEDNKLYRYIITSINGQSFARENGAYKTINDAYLDTKMSADDVLVGESLNLSVYAKDVLVFDLADLPVQVEIKDPNGKVSNSVVNGMGTLPITFNTLGKYEIKCSVTGVNGNTITQTHEVMCKSALSDITIDLQGSYPSSIDVGASLEILAATYSENVVSSSIVITGPNNYNQTVTAGQSVTFTVPGIYTITYTAADDAQPVPNTQTLVHHINVLDKTNPVISVDLPETAELNSTLQINVTVTDDSETDTTITVTSPSGAKKVTEGTSASVTFTETGTYVITIKATDLYENASTLTHSILVSEAQASEPATSEATSETPTNNGGCGGSIVAAGSVAGVALIAAVALIIAKKKEK